MSALENLVGSLGGAFSQNNGAADNSSNFEEKINSSKGVDENYQSEELGVESGDFWPIHSCTNLLIDTSDITSTFSTNHHLIQHILHESNNKDTKGLVLKQSCSFGPSPSRQSCLCPICGKPIAQRRSLKQHLMSNFHRLSPIKAETVVKDYLNTIDR